MRRALFDRNNRGCLRAQFVNPARTDGCQDLVESDVAPSVSPRMTPLTGYSAESNGFFRYLREQPFPPAKRVEAAIPSGLSAITGQCSSERLVGSRVKLYSFLFESDLAGG